MTPEVGVLGLYKFIDLVRLGFLTPGGRRSPIRMIKVGAKLTSSLPFFLLRTRYDNKTSRYFLCHFRPHSGL